MALSNRTMLIALDQGLNTYGNPHRMAAGALIGANGVALDKDSCVYPGLQLSSFAAAGTAVGTYRWGGGAYAASGIAANDVLLCHSSSISSSPAIFIATGGGAAAPTPVYPFNQATQQVAGAPSALTGLTAGTCLAPSVAYANNFACYVWLTTDGIPCFMREDLRSGERDGPFYYASTSQPWFSAQDVYSAGQGGFTKVGVTPAFVANSPSTPPTGFIIWVGGPSGATSLQYFAITLTLGSYNQTKNTLSLTSYNNFDCGYDATQAYVVVNDSGSVKGYNSNASFASPTTLSFPSTVPATSPLCLALSHPYESGTKLCVAAAHPTVGTVQFYFGTTAFTLLSATSFSYGSTAVVQIAGGISQGSIAWAFEFLNPVTVPTLTTTVAWNYVNFYIGTNSAAPAQVIQGVARAPGGMALLGKPWMDSLGVLATGAANALFPVRSGWNYYTGGPTASQVGYPNAYLVDTSGNYVAKWGDRDVGTTRVWPAFDNASYTGNLLPMLSQPALPNNTSATYAWPQMTYNEGLSVAAATLGQPVNPFASVAKVVFTQQVSNTTKYVQSGTSLVAPVSVTAVHDGVNTYEAGFFTAAPQPIVQLNTTSGALSNSSTYNYVLVLLYVDASGRYSYSAPSLPTTITTGSTGANSATIVFPTVYTTLKQRSITPIRYLLYRTVAGGASGTSTGANYYLVNSAQVNTLSGSNTGLSPNFVSGISDLASDLTVQAAPKIYTSAFSGAGAAAGTNAPPPFFSTCVWQNCVWGVAYRNGWELWFSWPLDSSQFEPEGLTFNVNNRIPIPADVGQVQAISGLDSSLIIFGTLKDYVVTGSVPIRSSTQADSPTFTPVVQLPTPSGIRVRNNVSTLPQGLIFQGTTGFLLLDRSMNYNDIGNAITDQTNNTLYGAGVLYAQGNCMVFPPIGTGNPLTYYYEENDWSVPLQLPSANSNWNQVVSLSPFRQNNYITNVGISSSSTTPLIQLGGNGTYLQAQTPWIEMMGQNTTNQNEPNVAGYGQLYEIQVQGDMRTDIAFPYNLTLMTEYGFVNNMQTPPDVQTITVADSSQQVPGPADLNWRFGFSTGQCRRVRFTLTFDATAGNYTLPLSSPLVAFSGLMLYYGVYDGLSRLGPGYSSPTGS